MTRMRKLWFVVAALAALSSGGAPFAADTPSPKAAKTEAAAIPTPAEVQSLSVSPAQVTLKGMDDSAQLILTGNLAGNRQQDLTGDVKYEVANPNVARVTTGGRIMPLANGSTEIKAVYGDKVAKVTLTTESCDVNLPINFPNQIVPIFTKLGCNSGGCHGKSGGQNGFALSLLGFVPELDFQTLVKENRGRRLFPASPDNSLLLLKATGLMAHGGGKRMEPGSDEYKLVRRWIASGTPFGNAEDPVVTKITVYPEARVLSRNNRQQFAVYAHYSDGSVADVTQRAQYESNDQEIAVVDGAALVRTMDMSGQAAIMARYQASR